MGKLLHDTKENTEFQ
jgi:hypothetical protein